MAIGINSILQFSVTLDSDLTIMFVYSHHCLHISNLSIDVRSATNHENNCFLLCIMIKVSLVLYHPPRHRSQISTRKFIPLSQRKKQSCKSQDEINDLLSAFHSCVFYFYKRCQILIFWAPL